MKARARCYLQDEEMRGVFGDGRQELLLAIKRCGSLREAADGLGRGYRKAWGDLRSAEKALGAELVSRSRGGSGGGYTRLTPLGERIVDGWRKFREDVSEVMETAYTRHLKDIIEGGEE